MPHAVHVWNFPTPRSLEQAAQIFRELPASGRPQNRSFLQLAQQLTARHPCNTTLPDDDPDAVWSGGPVDGVTSAGRWSVGIRSEHLDSVLPFLVETATTLGLVVYDEQRGEVHLPGGTTLTRDGAAPGRHFGLPIDGPFGAALVERTLTAALLPLLAGAGFTHHRDVGGLWRSDAQGSQLLRFVPQDGGAGIVAFDIEIVLVDHGLRKFVDGLLQEATQGREKSAATAMGSLARACRFFRLPDAPVTMLDDATLRFELATVDALRQLAIGLRKLVADHLLGQLDAWRDTDQIALSLFGAGHEHARSIGSLVRSTERGFTSAPIGGRLLDTRRCGGAAVGLVLAAAAKAPMLQTLIDDAYRDATDLPADRFADEKAKLDLAMAAMRETGLIS